MESGFVNEWIGGYLWFIWNTRIDAYHSLEQHNKKVSSFGTEPRENRKRIIKSIWRKKIIKRSRIRRKTIKINDVIWIIDAAVNGHQEWIGINIRQLEEDESRRVCNEIG